MGDKVLEKKREEEQKFRSSNLRWCPDSRSSITVTAFHGPSPKNAVVCVLAALCVQVALGIEFAAEDA
jgi:hypothetical protein